MDRMKELVAELDKHIKNYYVYDNPTISDAEYDKLYDELVALEKQTGIILPNSPTQRVNGEVLEGFQKHKHEVQLYSLNKCQNKEDLLYSFKFDSVIIPSPRTRSLPLKSIFKGTLLMVLTCSVTSSPITPSPRV